MAAVALLRLLALALPSAGALPAPRASPLGDAGGPRRPPAAAAAEHAAAAGPGAGTPLASPAPGAARLRRAPGPKDVGNVAGTADVTYERVVVQDSEETANEAVEWFADNLLVPSAVTFVTCIMVAAWVSSTPLARLLPESVMIIFVALVLGVVLRFGTSFHWYVSQADFDFGVATFLNLGLLPVIMFNLGWQLDRAHFMSEFWHVSNFAVLGTILTVTFIATISYYLGQAGLHSIDSWRANVAFACLISALDPMATISTFNKLGLKERQPLLHTLVLGEAAINDAVAITLFTLTNGHERSGDTWMPLLIITLFGSIALGCALSCLLIFMMGCFNMHGRERPLMLCFLGSAFLVFSIAESYLMSGIIANMVAGIVFRRYGSRLLTEHGECSTTGMFALFGSLAESLVFALVGAIASLLAGAEGLVFGVWATILCFAARGLAVPACAAVSNISKSIAGHFEERSPQNVITWKHQLAMWNSGLRGSVSLFLALELNPAWCGTSGKLVIVEGTFLVIVVVLILEGISTEWLLGFLGMVHNTREGGGAELQQPAVVGGGQWGTQWTTLVVDFFEPIVLGDKDELEVRVKNGALED